MTTCDGVRKNLTALADGDLPPRRSASVRRHLVGCPECAAEAQAIQSAVVGQQQLLRAALSADDVDRTALWQQLRQALDEPPPLAKRFQRPWLLSGGALAAAAALIAVVTASGPRPLLVSAGVESPPVAVSTKPELFKDYGLIQELDALEYFDTVESVPLDDEPTSQNG